MGGMQKNEACRKRELGGERLCSSRHSSGDVESDQNHKADANKGCTSIERDHFYLQAVSGQVCK